MTGLRRILTLGGVGVVGLLFVVGASCGGSSTPGGAAGTGGGAGANGAAGASGGLTTGPQGCTSLVTTLCNRDNVCNMLDGGASDLADCVRIQGIAIGCTQAPAATDFGACIDDVRIVSCASLFPAAGPTAPASCSDPLNTIPLSAAQQKCADLAEAACEKSAKCDGITPSVSDLQNCQAGVYDNLGCPLASAVGATFDQCITDLGNAACVSADAGADASGQDLPSCDTAITFAM